jgi:hypothetical protein
MARNRLRLSMSCYSQDPFRIAARSVPRPQGYSAGRRSRSRLDFSTGGDLSDISIIGRDDAFDLEQAFEASARAQQGQGDQFSSRLLRNGWGQRAQKARSGSGARGGECLVAIRFQRTAFGPAVAWTRGDRHVDRRRPRVTHRAQSSSTPRNSAGTRTTTVLYGFALISHSKILNLNQSRSIVTLSQVYLIVRYYSQ